MKDAEEANLDEEGLHDIEIEGDTEEKTTPFHKKLMRDAIKGECTTSSAAKLAASIRQKKKDTEREEQLSLKSESLGLNKKSGGPRSQWNEVSRLSKLQPSTVASILKRSVIYDNGDVVVINKPYGLPVHGGPGVKNNINELLPLLANLLKTQQTVAMETPSLHLIHRLDKETTGVMMLARSKVTARELHQLFFQRKVQKKYWVVTVGVPEPMEGIIDIPLIDKTIAGKNKMVVKPELGSLYQDVTGPSKKQTGSHTAITNFRVISHGGGAALVELIPETGVKHQLRVHMSQGLGCPILGDHKYSHFNKLAPQVLPKSLLQRFDIEQAKSRNIPMHLHAHQLRIPDFQGRRALTVSVRLPRFFAKTLQKLRLSIP